MTPANDEDRAIPDGGEGQDDELAPPAAGTVLSGRYVLESRIGQGGMGWVYRATDVALQRAVAIKILLPSLSRVPEVYARFAREARAVAALDHPNIVPVFDVGHDAPWHFFVMKLLDGVPLADKLVGGVLPILEAVDLAAQVLSGLEHLHERGLAHRDIKPGNVFVTREGGAVLLDFGILLTASVETRVTAAGLFVGTPEYVAPEIVQARPGDARSDQYGLGITLYEMLTGVVPFDGGSAIEIAARRLRDDPAPLRARRPEVPPALEAAVHRALERSPGDRFPSARAMRDALVAAARGFVPPASVPVLPEPRAAWARTQVLPRRQRSRRALVAVAVLMALSGAVAWVVGIRRGADDEPRRAVVEALGTPGISPSPPLPPPADASLSPPLHPPAPVEPSPPAGASSAPAPTSAAVASPSPTNPSPPSVGTASAGSARRSDPARPRAGTPRNAPPRRSPEAAGSSPSPAPAPRGDIPTAAPPAPAKGSTLERARAALRAGLNAEALRLFQEASRAAPGSAAPLRGLGDAYLAVGNRTAAMAAYRRFLALDPGARDAPAVRARLQAMGGP